MARHCIHVDMRVHSKLPRYPQRCALVGVIMSSTTMLCNVHSVSENAHAGWIECCVITTCPPTGLLPILICGYVRLRYTSISLAFE